MGFRFKTESHPGVNLGRGNLTPGVILLLGVQNPPFPYYSCRHLCQWVRASLYQQEP
jgi:hypothetical protein